MKIYNEINYPPFKCDLCSKLFMPSTRDVYKTYKKHKNRGIYNVYCSLNCRVKARTRKIRPKELTCLNCQNTFKPHSSKSKFCSRSCAASYNNKHKTFGTRRSKLEKWIESQLQELYPNLEILYSNKSEINSELDIYIPSLKLAFELNGIFHYEPIFGESKLNQTQQNDANKFQLCQAKGISLCVIDTSSQKYVKPSTSQKFLDIITNIINKNLAKE